MLALRRLVFLAILVGLATTPRLLAQGLPLTMSKSFSPPSVLVGGTATTTMTVTITNPNGFSVSGISFSDTYPAGLVPDQVGAYTCSAGSAIFTGSGWALSNVTLGAGASCSVPMLMHATTAGPITNTTSQVTGTGVPPGGPASATLNAFVPAPNTPTLSEWMLVALAMAIAIVAAMRMSG
ncbi:MAG: IPTL-CTERM sorting domain-containing protein [Thermoanaerobaculia bacterium]